MKKSTCRGIRRAIPRSLWSAANKRHVARLIREGRMTEQGLAKVESGQEERLLDEA